MTEEPFAWVRPWDGDVSDEGKYIFVSSLDEIDEARESRDDYTPLYLHPPSEEAKERQAEWLTQVVRDAATPPAPEGWAEAVKIARDTVGEKYDGYLYGQAILPIYKLARAIISMDALMKGKNNG